MPCLNEVETIPICVEKARSFLARSGVAGEVLIADNGSTDGSAALAEQGGARVIAVAERGYRAALMAVSQQHGGTSSSWAMPMTATISLISIHSLQNCATAATS